MSVYYWSVLLIMGDISVLGNLDNIYIKIVHADHSVRPPPSHNVTLMELGAHCELPKNA